MDRPKVSIGVPVYNGQRYLEFALRSLLDQTFSDFELIVCDNKSTDQTAQICRDLAATDRRVKYHRNETNIGANPNFNRVLELATGDYFRWAAYDDICKPTYLQRCVDALNADPTAALAHTRTAIIDETGRRIDTNAAALAANGLAIDDVQDPPRRLTSDSPVARYADIVLRTKWCFEIFGLFRTPMLRLTGGMGNFYGTDKVLLANMALQGKFIEIDEELFLRRYHEGQSSQIKSPSQRAVWSGATRTGGFLSSQRKCLAGYRKAICLAPLGVGQKIACNGVLLRYAFQMRKWAKVVGLSSRNGPTPTLKKPTLATAGTERIVH